jgi:hypothetical protein
MLWQTLHHLDIHLYMAYPNIALPRERDQVITDIFLSMDLSPDAIRSLNRCRVSLESIFLLDLTTVDGRYLEDYVFNPGGRGRSSKYKFPREQPTWGDWNQWFDFWHSFLENWQTLHIAFGNGITERIPTTSSRSRATPCFFISQSWVFILPEQPGHTMRYMKFPFPH